MTDPKPPPFSMVREFKLADFVTLINAACGTVAIFLCLSFLDDGHPLAIWFAIAMIPAAFLADGLDGWVARKRNSFSRLGADLDSLADIISFGVAPAVLGFTLGMRGGWDIFILVYFVMCGLARLARFNVTAEELAGEDGKVEYFEGTPIPTSLILVVILAFAVYDGAIDKALWFGEVRWGLLLHPLALMYFVSGSLMISARLRIPKP